MNPAILLMSSVLMTGGTPALPVVQGAGCEGCGSVVALPPSCIGCGSCGTGICGPGDPNPLEKKGLFALLRKRFTPAASSSCCGSARPGLLGGGLFQGGLLGRLRNVGAPAGCVGAGCGCNEPPIMIGNTLVSGCATPVAPTTVMAPPATAPQAMPAPPAAPAGEGRPEKAPAPMPMPPAKSGVSLPALPSIPLTPASGPAAATGKPRF